MNELRQFCPRGCHASFPLLQVAGLPTRPVERLMTSAQINSSFKYVRNVRDALTASRSPDLTGKPPNGRPVEVGVSIRVASDDERAQIAELLDLEEFTTGRAILGEGRHGYAS